MVSSLMAWLNEKGGCGNISMTLRQSNVAMENLWKSPICGWCSMIFPFKPIQTSIYSGFPIATVTTFDDRRVHMHTHTLTSTHGFMESMCLTMAQTPICGYVNGEHAEENHFQTKSKSLSLTGEVWGAVKVFPHDSDTATPKRCRTVWNQDVKNMVFTSIFYSRFSVLGLLLA